jgi:hypothetical protein
LGGRESATTVRKRQLRSKEQNPKAWRRSRAKQKLRYYPQFQKNTRHKGTRWTPVEDARITAEDRPTDRKLSRALGLSASDSATTVVPVTRLKVSHWQIKDTLLIDAALVGNVMWLERSISKKYRCLSMRFAAKCEKAISPAEVRCIDFERN